jgi:hypothetical protein
VILRSASYSFRKLLSSVKQLGRENRNGERSDERKAGKENKGIKDMYDAGGDSSNRTSDNMSYRVTSFFYVVYMRGGETTISRLASLSVCLLTPLNFTKLAGFDVLTAATIEVSEKCTASIFMFEE